MTSAATKTGVALLLALMAATAWAGVYRWVDKNGVVHYSDSPPPSGAKLVAVESTPTDPAAVTARKKALQKQVTTYQKQRHKAAVATAKAEQKQQQREKACKRAQSRVAQLAGIDRLRLHGADGKTQFLSGNDLAAYKQKERERAAKLCDAN
ncbi:MAG TPA: DUF4124 domain-containing protein [Gammaproteobacteria bacterium]|nr:DUF4124 domain-containing protein [Gammaproteobacteria bacterium]